ncbi:hypothetical protein JHN62_33760, partial [Streptomyces sp. MBT54]|nr:hypothetical protein [Streptomyces sp. MBT54]
MYEPIRSPSVHTPADDADFPHRSREEGGQMPGELDVQLLLAAAVRKVRVV